jgi:hypothetical protein
MKSWFPGFNIFLLGLALGLGAGCQTTDDPPPPGASRKQEFCLLRFFIEANPDATGRNQIVSLFRENPSPVCVEKIPVLTEADIEQVSLLDQVGGFGVLVQFNDRGTRLLEMTTASHPGKRLAVFAQYSIKRKTVESLWLAAPRITHRIANGAFVFAPDATREQANRIVEGLTHLLAEAKKND